VTSIQDAYDFFYDGEYNGRREVTRLRERMQDDFEDWASDQLYEDWQENQFEYVYQYLINNVGADEVAEILGLDPETIDSISKQQAQEAAQKVIEEQLEPYYVEAQDAHREDFYQDEDREQEWLESEDLDMMSAIENRYEITWPHWQTIDSGSGDTSIDAVADDFSTAIGRPVNTSQRYSTGIREPGKYVVEPDGSISPDDEDSEAGLEFVSPPLPIDEMLSDLNKVRAWAKTVGAYTNDSTGLHINISVPNFDPEKLDYVKLALLLGDKYVLDQFGRSSNTYTESALGKVEAMVRKNPQAAQTLLNKMRGHMADLATKAIHSGETKKYTSINTKENRIEFRSPGGDWLDENFDKIENTLLRFTVALSAAMNPEAYREEYLKKLYKLLDPQGGESRGPTGRGGKETIRYFADYVAGNLPQDALRSFVKQAQLERQVKRGQAKGQKMWWEVSNPQYSFASINVVATSREEAIEKALGPDGYPSWVNTRQTVVAEPLRPYEEKPVQSTELTLGGRPSNPDGNWVIVGNRRPVYRFMASGQDDAETVWLQWSREHTGNWELKYDPDQSLGQPGQQPAQPAAQSNFNNLSQTDYENRLGWPDQTGDANYEIVDRRTGRRVFVMVANTDQDAQRKYTDWLAATGYPEDTENYGYREISSGPGSTLDRQLQRAAQQNSGQFTGEWRVLLPSGEEVYRFYGAGNNQGDANRVAADWLRRNGMGVSGEGFAVLPVMG